MSELSTSQIREALEMCEKATPAPWRAQNGAAPPDMNECAVVRGITIVGPYKAVACGKDAAFIAASRTLLPAALRDLLAAREQNERLKGVLREVEWAAEGYRCPICNSHGSPKINGRHSPACALDAALKEGDG